MSVRMTYKDYISGVMSGEILTGKMVKLTVQRHLSDLTRQNAPDFPYYFDENEGERWINFAYLCRHWKGTKAGKPIELNPWQQFYFMMLFGWRSQRGGRRFRNSYLEIARKNGKTTMAAVIALGHKIIDKEAGAQVYFVATKEDQARIGFNDAKEIVSKSPGLNKLYKSFAKSVVGGDSVIKPLGSDSDTQDGFDPSVGIVDEYHAHQTSGMLNVLRTGMGMRRSPLISIITTAGFNRVYPCYSETRTACIKILNGVLTDERQFALIYTLDEDDDWQDKSVWGKSNPNLNELEPDYLDIQYNLSINEGGSMEVQFKTKNLNIWCDSERTWIPDETWMACTGELGQLEGEECYAALDLSSNKDITSLVLVFQGEKLRILPFFFIPELSAKDRMKKDGVNYGSWINSGHIEETEGNVTDYDYIRMRIGELAETYQIKRIAYDRWNSSQLIINLTADGFDCSPFGQGFASMSGPTKELEKMVIGKQIIHDGNPVMRWMCSNISIATDPSGNIKINKQKAREKVDGMVALVMAIGNYMTSERTEEVTSEIYLI